MSGVGHVIYRYVPVVIRDPGPDSFDLIPAPPEPRVSGTEAGEEVVSLMTLSIVLTVGPALGRPRQSTPTLLIDWGKQG